MNLIAYNVNNDYIISLYYTTKIILIRKKRWDKYFIYYQFLFIN